MAIWILFAVITTATTAALLHPLASAGRSRRPSVSQTASTVYRNQLLELEEEKEAGQIAPSEYELARAETARRLLRTKDKVPEQAMWPRSHLWLRVSIVSLLPLLSIGVYVAVGSPELSSQPLQARLRNPGQDVAILIQKTEQHLAQDPADGRGWDVIAPVLLKIGRAGDAENAYRNAVRILGQGVPRLDGLAESLMAQSGGTVTPQAQAVLRQVLELEPENPRARFYLALSLEQANDKVGARQAFEALAATSPMTAPWMPLVREHIAANSGAPVERPGKTDTAAAGSMRSGQEAEMIRRMVDGLDARLTTDPNNLDGWLKLIRSYAILKDDGQALAALRRGLAAFPADSEQGKQLLALARELEIATEGMSE
ncbi:c-type cytochrome biogenesis protein CcmI [Rhizobium sp. R693]|uniref:c-type cytochrome biogenesis protein CcmI n=1 Tax=Rhizobium sp. R693 TaxID=1764276 RepID=UPI000B52C342|nr:c-type cytochrome biogenesis protein CcmI [Rhizobium sp. R693]OWV84678.1 cytochrome C biogenesis protein CycH [Rhizobium sp. R693]